MSSRVDVLLVEDQPSSLFLLRSILERASYRVDEALTGEHALERLSARSYDVLIVDLNLPDMSGVEMLKRSTRRPPAIAITGRGSEIPLDVARVLDIAAFLRKPVSAPELLAAIEKVVTGKAAANEIQTAARLIDLAVFSDIRAAAEGALLEEFVHRALTDARACITKLKEHSRALDPASWLEQAQALSGVALMLGASALASAVAEAINIPTKQLLDYTARFEARFDELIDKTELAILARIGLLTSRERECLRLVADGHSTKAIAALLGISDQTVNFHITKAGTKLTARGRTQIVAKALKSGAI